MNNRGMLWIIPNEEEIIQEEFKREAIGDISHMYYIQEFSDKYNLGFDLKEDDYQTAPCEIALSGHMVIKSEENSKTIIVYFPDIVTNRQFDWLYKNKMMLNDYIQIGGYSLQTSNEDGICWKKLYGLEEIMMESRKKNTINERGMKK